MKLNGWQRIGVVASAVWCIGAAFYVRSEQAQLATAFHARRLNDCLPEFTKLCTDRAHEIFQKNLSLDSISVINIAFASIGPVIAGWVLAYLTLKVVQWVKAGFK